MRLLPPKINDDISVKLADFTEDGGAVSLPLGGRTLKPSVGSTLLPEESSEPCSHGNVTGVSCGRLVAHPARHGAGREVPGVFYQEIFASVTNKPVT